MLVRLNNHIEVSRLSHPHLIVLQVPLCELETEKGGLEEKTLRSGLLLNSLERLGRQGYDIEDSKNEADKILKEAMIKLFAVSFGCGKGTGVRKYVSA